MPFNDIEALEKHIDETTCAVMIELIQSEGGVNVADAEYVKKVRELTKNKDILLMVDEVQTGMGRTGTFFAYEQFGIEPDVMSLAKALGNGFPVGAIIAKDAVMAAFEPGTHASTFGGTLWRHQRSSRRSTPSLKKMSSGTARKSENISRKGSLPSKRNFPSSLRYGAWDLSGV